MIDVDRETLRQRLEDDHPKCANCKSWRPFDRGLPIFGRCAKSGYLGEYYVTPNLSVCSEWERNTEEGK